MYECPPNNKKWQCRAWNLLAVTTSCRQPRLVQTNTFVRVRRPNARKHVCGQGKQNEVDVLRFVRTICAGNCAVGLIWKFYWCPNGRYKNKLTRSCPRVITCERVRMIGLFLFFCPKKKCGACVRLSEMSARPSKKIKIVNSSAIGGNVWQPCDVLV